MTADWRDALLTFRNLPEPQTNQHNYIQGLEEQYWEDGEGGKSPLQTMNIKVDLQLLSMHRAMDLSPDFNSKSCIDAIY